ncbi:hypothetical protein PLESTB_001558800 [Pleodorina starrii]|uniref:Uncharacterized protein n=1 Tax=Pleodorina starrii TaxID=330485 RepID=A0A9W6BY84_9CHLO|nr:hypothetical protein PLESTB_001558800 [Pleodorina starrii]
MNGKEDIHRRYSERRCSPPPLQPAAATVDRRYSPPPLQPTAATATAATATAATATAARVANVVLWTQRQSWLLPGWLSYFAEYLRPEILLAQKC